MKAYSADNIEPDVYNSKVKYILTPTIAIASPARPGSLPNGLHIKCILEQFCKCDIEL